MNTLTSPLSLRTPGLRDPIRVLFSFIGKCRGLAKKRADHGAVLEYNVVEKMVDREAQLRDAGARSAELIAQKIAAVQDYYRTASADGQLTPAEDIRIREQLEQLYGELMALSNGLEVPVAG